MLTKDGVKILNFKCQFGDPQCQVSERYWKLKYALFFYLWLLPLGKCAWYIWICIFLPLNMQIWMRMT